MAGSEADRSGEGKKKEKKRDRLTSLFKKLKDRPTKTDEQSSLPHRPSEPLATANQPDTTQASKSSSAQPVADKEDVPIVNTTLVGSYIASKQPTEPRKPISELTELWNEAYEELKDKEESLMKKYEDEMSKDMTTMLGSTSLALGASEVAVRRKEQMTVLVDKKVVEAKKSAWKLKYGDHEILLRDLAEPVVNIINDAEKFVDGAVSANPYASIAWAGVSLLLPVSLEFRYPIVSRFIIGLPMGDPSTSITL
jgi:hypothetical protein